MALSSRPDAPVIILFGGTSSERLVSVATTQNLSTALPGSRLWFISPGGGVHEVDGVELAAHERAFERPFAPVRAPRFAGLDAALDEAARAHATILIGLHGGEGENGTLQAKLEQRRIPFTASGSRASALAFDKARAKELVAARGVRVARSHELPPLSLESAQRRLGELLAEHPRWVLKPACDGSSFGVVHVRATGDIPQAASQLATLGVRYLAEEFVEGRELTVGVVDEEASHVALPVSEVRLAQGATFDYEGKYLGRGTEEVTPAALTEAEREDAQGVALAAHDALGCFGYTRTDLILGPSGCVFLETNTLPGLTRASFFPQQVAAAKRDFGDFVRQQLALAKRRAGQGT